jgi:acyl-[acyl carrier protein]--UDP-N-acetylglucosamine O-acyltransferase
MSYLLPKPVTYLGATISRLAWNGEPVDSETLTWVHPNSNPDWDTFCPALAFVPFTMPQPYRAGFIPRSDPRSAFGEAMHEIIGKRRLDWSMSHSPGNMVGDDVMIPASTSIGWNNVIYPGVRIGEHVTIGNNNVIGGPGFNVYRSRYPAAHPHRFLHVGGVEIGNGVIIHNNCNIDAGILSPTVIGSSVAFDSCIHVGHDSRIGRGVNITAGVVLCGWVTIEADAWLSPNVTVRNWITVGEGAKVGLAANVVKDVPRHSVVKGNPARLHEPHVMDVLREANGVLA